MQRKDLTKALILAFVMNTILHHSFNFRDREQLILVEKEEESRNELSSSFLQPSKNELKNDPKYLHS